MPAEIAKYLRDVKATLDKANAGDLTILNIGMQLQQSEKIIEKQLNFTLVEKKQLLLNQK